MNFVFVSTEFRESSEGRTRWDVVWYSGKKVKSVRQTFDVAGENEHVT